MKVNKHIFVIISVVLIALLCFFVYGNSLKCKFIWDDNFMIRDNELIRNWSGATKIFTQDIGYGVGQKVGFYRPLQLMTYMLDYSIWKLNPAGYHLTNIFLHLLVGCLVFWLLGLFYVDRFVSLFTSLLFIVHPIHVEAVAYIAGRADILVAFFIVFSFIFYIKYFRSKNTNFYLIMLLSYVGALLSRENSLVFPLLVLSFHLVYKQKLKFREFFPIVLISILYIIFRLEFIPSHPVIVTSSFFERILGFFYALSSYTRILIFPVNLHMEYGLKPFHLFELKVILGIIILALSLLAIIKQKSRDIFVVFLIIWFMVNLLPMSNLYPITAYMAEHWLYLPSIGFFSLCVYALYKNIHTKSICLISMLIIIFIFSYLTIKQTNYWLDPINFFKRTLRYAPDSYNLYLNLAVAYQDMDKPQEAIAAYKKAIVLDPKKLKSYSNLAALYATLNRTDEAVDILNKALKIKPDNAEMWVNLGVIDSQLGKNQEALRLIKKAIELDPHYLVAYLNLGAIYADASEKFPAIAAYEQAIRINPNSAKAYYCLGKLNQDIGKTKEAIAAYKKVIAIDSSQLDVYISLGSILGNEGAYLEALGYLQQALRINPSDALVYNNIGITYARMKQWDKAEKSWAKALEINPELKEAQDNLVKLKQLKQLGY